MRCSVSDFERREFFSLDDDFQPLRGRRGGGPLIGLSPPREPSRLQGWLSSLFSDGRKKGRRHRISNSLGCESGVAKE